MTIDTNTMNFEKAGQEMIASDADVLSVSQTLLAKNKEAYEVLAK